MKLLKIFEIPKGVAPPLSLSLSLSPYLPYLPYLLHLSIYLFIYLSFSPSTIRPLGHLIYIIDDGGYSPLITSQIELM